MPRTLIYLSSCGIHEDGQPDPFMLQEMPWLTRHFDKVWMVSHYGVATLTGDPHAPIQPLKLGFAGLRSWLTALFSRDLWREVRHLSKDHKLTPVNFLKLLMFTRRGLEMHHWTELVLRSCIPNQTVLYSCWMSFDAYGAALSKRKHPRLRFVVRGHAFDIDVERNPMNPYLMKGMIAGAADGIYPISQVAQEQYMSYMQGVVRKGKVHVLPMGSGGEKLTGCKRAPLYAQSILRVVSCAKIIPIKQVPVLVEALAGWQGGTLHWTHIGGGEGMEVLRKLCEEKLDGKENILYELLGDLDSSEVNAVYEKRSFDVFINTSYKEGVPVSIMEAMRYGIPVIAPSVGGIPELVTPEVGFLYPPEEGSAGVLKRLERLAALGEDETNKLRQAAQKRWNEEYCCTSLLPRLFPEALKKGER